MIIITEAPGYKAGDHGLSGASVSPIGMLARKGELGYVRRILGYMVDCRVEDMGISIGLAKPIVGRLPDIPVKVTLANGNRVWQNDVYFVAEGPFAVALIRGAHAENLVEASKAERLPSKWWEFAAVFDQDHNWIKAPKKPRQPFEPSAAEVDDILDDFVENQGIIEVKSPITLRQMDYRDRLQDL